MIQDRTILCFASGYDAPPTSKHHVMHLLAEKNVVLWVNYHASRTPAAGASDVLYLFKKLGQVVRGMSSPRQNLHVLTPLVVPLPGRAWAKKLNRYLVVRSIRRALRKVQRGPLQIWSFAPDVSYLVDQSEPERIVYYCVDDFASFTGYESAQVLRDEAELCCRADLVVTTSMALQQAKQPLNPNTILVPHGVDYEHFSKAVTNSLPTPSDIADIPHPRLGFFGLVRDWVDLDLLAEVASARPDWHIVMLGDSTVDLTPYRDLPNIHFLGRKPYEDLPAYCRQFSVGLIPFKINQLTRSVNPIKLREYLAAGLPVVSTPLPETKLYDHLIQIADTPEAFSAAIERALVADPAARRERTQAMAREAWTERVALILERLLCSPEAGQPKGAQSSESQTSWQCDSR